MVTNKHNKNRTIERRFSNRTKFLYTATVGKIRPIGPLSINQIDLAKAQELHKTIWIRNLGRELNLSYTQK